MPDMDGIEVCRRIKARPQWQSIPIIMVTALTDKSDLAQCLSAGADDFISKPVHAVELQARIESMLRIKYQYDQLQSFSTLQRDTINLLGRNLQALRGDVTSNFSYELNAPLTSVLGSIGMLRADMSRMSPEKAQDFLEFAYQSALNLEKLTQKFLLSLEVEALHQAPVSSEKVSTRHVIDSVGRVKAEQYQRTTDLNLVFENCADIEIAMPQKYAQRLIDELLDNAFRASSAGTPVTVLCQLNDTQLSIEIIDEGKGVSAEQMSRINTGKPLLQEGQSLGFGLKIVQKLVNLYQGQLKVASVQEQGTKVSIHFPLDKIKAFTQLH